VTGTYRGCDGKLTGRIEKNIFTVTYTEGCNTDTDTTTGTFAVTMAANNQSFIGVMYKTGGYGARERVGSQLVGKENRINPFFQVPDTATIQGTLPLKKMRNNVIAILL
jgi:hypothetical protein